MWGKQLLKKTDLRFAIKVGLASGLALFVGEWFSTLLGEIGPDKLISGLWTSISAIIVMQTHVGGSYKKGWMRLLGTFVGTVFGAAFTNLLGSDPISLSIGVIATIVLCSLANLKSSITLASVSAALVLILWELKPTISPWIFAYFRIVDSFLGISIGIAVMHLLWPAQATDQLRLNVQKLIGKIRELYRFAISEELRGADAQSHFMQLVEDVEEKFQENRLILEDAKTELIRRPGQLGKWTMMQNQLERMVDSLITLQHTNKQYLKEIFDPELLQHTDVFIENILKRFQEISEALIADTPPVASQELSAAAEALNADLVRFRATHRMKKYEYDEVESVFVFFYSLKLIAKEVSELTKTIETFYALPE